MPPAAPEGEAAVPAPGLVVANPPYGERLQARAGLPALYAEFAERLRRGFDGWTLAVITPDAGLSAGLRMTPKRTVELYNGPIKSLVSVFEVGARSRRTTAASREHCRTALGGRALAGSAEAFANRLRKMAQPLSRSGRAGAA